MKHGKKYTDGAKLIDRSNLYDSGRLDGFRRCYRIT